MIIYPTSQFRKAFKKLPNTIKEKATIKDEVFRKNSFVLTLQTHKLEGKLKDYWAYSIDNNYRVLFSFVSKNEVIYFNIGTHEIYK